MAAQLPDDRKVDVRVRRDAGENVDQTPDFVISVAARLAGMHAQTLRQYDRLGLVTPSRTQGGGRRYSAQDVERLREVQRLSQEEGVSLAGVRRILELENELAAVRSRLREVLREVEDLRESASGRRVFTVTPSGDVALRRGPVNLGVPDQGRSVIVWAPTTR